MTQSAKRLPAAERFSADTLKLDAQAEIERICDWIRQVVGKDLRKRGAVLGLSGGIDSSVTAALSARALGKGKVTGIFMPEHDSDPESDRPSCRALCRGRAQGRGAFGAAGHDRLRIIARSHHRRASRA